MVRENSLRKLSTDIALGFIGSHMDINSAGQRHQAEKSYLGRIREAQWVSAATRSRQYCRRGHWLAFFTEVSSYDPVLPLGNIPGF